MSKAIILMGIAVILNSIVCILNNKKILNLELSKIYNKDETTNMQEKLKSLNCEILNHPSRKVDMEMDHMGKLLGFIIQCEHCLKITSKDYYPLRETAEKECIKQMAHARGYKLDNIEQIAKKIDLEYKERHQ